MSSTNKQNGKSVLNAIVDREKSMNSFHVQQGAQNGKSVLSSILEREGALQPAKSLTVKSSPATDWRSQGFDSQEKYNAAKWRQKYSGQSFDQLRSAMSRNRFEVGERDWLQRYMETDRDFLSTLSSKQIDEIMAGVNDRLSKSNAMPTINSYDEYGVQQWADAMKDYDPGRFDLESRAQGLEWAKNLARRRERIESKYGSYAQDEAFENIAAAGAARKNATAEELEAYDMERVRPSQSYADGVYDQRQSGIPKAPAVENELAFFNQYKDSKKLSASADRIISKGRKGNWEQLHEDEVQLYNYLLQSRGAETAEEYLKDLELHLAERASAAQSKRTAEQYKAYDGAGGFKGTAGKVGMNLASIPANVAGGAASAVGQVVSAVAGEYNPYKWGSLAQYGRDVRENTADDIVEAIGKEHPVWGQIAANTYQAAMSGADSALGAILLGNGYTAVMASSAAAQRAQELYERGASGIEIGMGAVASGAIEWLTEEYSIEKFTERFMSGRFDRKLDIIKNVLLQGLNEGSEELVSELSNMVANAMILGANSDNQLEIRKLMLDGLTHEEAEKKALANRALDAFWAAYGGFVSGAGMGVVGAVYNEGVNHGRYMESGRNILNAGTREALAEQAGDTRLSRKVSRDAENGNTGRAAIKRAGRLYENTTSRQVENIRTAERGAVRKAVTDELKNRNISDPSGVIAAVIEKAAYDEDMSRTERRLYENLGGEKILQDISENEAVQESVEKATEQSRKQLRQTAELTVDTKELAKMVDADSLNVSTEGKTLVTGTDGSTTETAVKGVKAVGGKLMIALEDGSTAKNSQISYADSGEAALYTVVSGMNIPEASANALIQAAPADIAAKERYAFGVQEMYRYGALGIPMGAVSNPVFASSLTAAQRQAAYNLGKNAYQKANAAAVEGLKQKTTAKRGEGRVSFDGNEKSLSDIQRGSLKALRLVAKALKVNIEVFQSETRDGKHIGENGSYDPTTGTIRIDISAGADGKGTMLFTLAHELTHFMKEWSPAKYQTFSAFLLDNYAENGVPVDLLVQRQMEKAKRNGRTISRETALEEVVADSCEQMLSDGRAIERLEELRQADRTVFEKVVDFIHDIAEKVKELYKGLQPDSLEARYVAQMQDAFERLQELWTEGVADAAGNFERADVVDSNSQAEQGTNYSLRNDIVDVNGKEYDVVVQLDKQVSSRTLSNPKMFMQYIENNLLGLKIPVLDEAGNVEIIEFAGKNETVSKNGKRHPVIGELAYAKGDIKSRLLLTPRRLLHPHNMILLFPMTKAPMAG